jgi:hypothetical protein
MIGWVIALALSCAIVFGSTFMLGPALFAVPDLDEKLAVALFCPGAEHSSLEQGASTSTTTSPSGTSGHTVEVTCHFADGSTRVIRNEQYALAAIGGTFGLGGLIGILVSTPVLLLPLVFIRKKKV